jgi:antirestriction protein ArdC
VDEAVERGACGGADHPALAGEWRVPYQGINVLMLWSEAVTKGYSAPIWMTFRQALELNAHVRKGERGAATRADIRHGGNMAYYNIGSDFVQMPPFEAFRDAESYYATLAHECTSGSSDGRRRSTRAGLPCAEPGWPRK